MPKNPFTGKSDVRVINLAEDSGQPFVELFQDEFGWVYVPEIKQIWLDKTGIDSKGVEYYTY